MRFIIHEMPYERPLRAGIFRYEQDAQPTGAVEQWRLTTVSGGYRFLRVDLDARAAPSGQSTLYHLTMNERGQPEQLKFRFWADGIEASGILLCGDDALTLTRNVNGARHEEEIARDRVFWLPSSVGLGMLARAAQEGAHHLAAVTLDTRSLRSPAQAEAAFALRRADLTLCIGPEEELAVRRETHVVRPLLITWDDQQRTIWIDEHGWPLQMRRQDGLIARETQYIRYPTAN